MSDPIQPCVRLPRTGAIVPALEAASQSDLGFTAEGDFDNLSMFGDPATW